MKQLTFNIFIFIIFPSFLFGQHSEADSIRVYFLGGQSNMDGYGHNSELPETLNKNFEDVWIFHGNSLRDDQLNGGSGKWDILAPGHGRGFSSDGNNNKLSNFFGIELSFVRRLQELEPGQKIAVIKYSRGGSSIDSLAAGRFGSWEADYRGLNGMNQYDYFLNTVKKALNTRDIDKDGKRDILIPAGIIWMQGESDAAYTEEIANRYYSNLKRLMDMIRASFLTDDLPVVIGKISDSHNDTDGKVWEYGELVQYAQEKYVKTDENAAIVRSTEHYDYSDPWHYDSMGYIDLGEKFAEAVHKLNNDQVARQQR